MFQKLYSREEAKHSYIVDEMKQNLLEVIAINKMQDTSEQEQQQKTVKIRTKSEREQSFSDEIRRPS